MRRYQSFLFKVSRVGSRNLVSGEQTWGCLISVRAAGSEAVISTIDNISPHKYVFIKSDMEI